MCIYIGNKRIDGTFNDEKMDATNYEVESYGNELLNERGKLFLS